MNRIVWIVMLTLIVVLGDQAYDRMAEDDGRLTVEVPRGASDPVVMTWRGPVQRPMASAIGDAYRANEAVHRKFVLVLDSPGGEIAHGNKVIRLLDDIRRTHELDTAVERGDQCASMCVPIFLRGEHRTAAPNSHWLFHEVTVRDAVSDEEKDVSEYERRAMTDEFFERYFRPVGVPGGWVDQMRKAVAGGDVWLTGRDLVSDGSNIVTALR